MEEIIKLEHNLHLYSCMNNMDRIATIFYQT